MEKKQRRRVLLAVTLGVLAAVTAGQGLLRHCARRRETKLAVRGCMARLEERYRAGVLPLLAGALDSEGHYTAQVRLRREGSAPVSAEADLLTDGALHRVLAQGSARSGDGPELTGRLYLDSAFAAVSLPELGQGDFYGITYRTFARDIRELPLLGLLVSDMRLAEWEDALGQVRDGLRRDHTLPSLPEGSPEALHALGEALERLPYAIRAQDGGGREYVCQLTMGQLSRLLPGFPSEEGAELVFRTQDGEPAEAALRWGGEEQGSRLAFALGEPFTLDWEGKGLSLHLDSRLEKGAYEDHWVLSWNQDRRPHHREFRYRWMPETATAALLTQGETAARVTLRRSGETLGLETDDLGGVLHWLAGESGEKGSVPVSCQAALRAGSALETPGYKNLDSWSMEEFFTLLTQVGPLMDIQLG